MNSLFQLKSINERIELSILKEKGVEVFIKREDLTHSSFGGNKLRKLKYHIREFRTGDYKGIVTFGGAWSNHIAATAAICSDFNIPCMGIIRGEKSKTPSDTIVNAERLGMDIRYISRTDYRKKSEPTFLSGLSIIPKNYLIVPEGGSGIKGVIGCTEILQKDDSMFDYIFCACGTGGTLAGITISTQLHQETIGISSLKGGKFLEDDIKSYLKEFDNKGKFQVNDDYHFGGYGKSPIELITFIRWFHKKTEIKLDPIYTGKMVFGLLDLIRKNKFKPGSKILAIHTGGLQGLKGIERHIKELIYQ